MLVLAGAQEGMGGVAAIAKILLSRRLGKGSAISSVTSSMIGVRIELLARKESL